MQFKVGKGPWKLHWDDKTGTFDKVIIIIIIITRVGFKKGKICLFAGEVDVNSWQKEGEA